MQVQLYLVNQHDSLRGAIAVEHIAAICDIKNDGINTAIALRKIRKGHSAPVVILNDQLTRFPSQLYHKILYFEII